MSYREKNIKGLSLIIVLFSLSFLIFPRTTHAYLNPGTFSLIIQVILGVMIGGSFAVKLYWTKIKNFLTTHFSKRKKDEKKEL